MRAGFSPSYPNFVDWRAQNTALRFNRGGAWEREFQLHRRRRTGTLAGAARLGGVLLHPGHQAARWGATFSRKRTVRARLRR